MSCHICGNQDAPVEARDEQRECIPCWEMRKHIEQRPDVAMKIFSEAGLIGKHLKMRIAKLDLKADQTLLVQVDAKHMAEGDLARIGEQIREVIFPRTNSVLVCTNDITFSQVPSEVTWEQVK